MLMLMLSSAHSLAVISLNAVASQKMEKDPRVKAWEREFAAEVTHTLIDFTTRVLVPLTHEYISEDADVQAKFMKYARWRLPSSVAEQQCLDCSYMHRFLTSNQSDFVIVRVFGTLATLLCSYAPLVWSPINRALDPQRSAARLHSCAMMILTSLALTHSLRCPAWWYELVRHMCFRSIAASGAFRPRCS